MSDKFQALRNAAHRCTRVNAEVALLCEAALDAATEGEQLEARLQQVGQAARDNRSRRILELEAEVEALRATNVALTEHYDGTGEAVTELRKKAARYDWLLAHWGYVTETYTDGGPHVESVYLVGKDDGWDTDSTSLDAAIDKAMGAKEQSHG